jgi:hypothetical protein
MDRRNISSTWFKAYKAAYSGEKRAKCEVEKELEKLKQEFEKDKQDLEKQIVALKVNL